MRWVLLVAFAGCTFAPGVALVGDGPSPDIPKDTPPDMTDVPVATWSIDPTSMKACPATSAEWNAFITSKQLGIAAPSSIWSMQDAAGSLVDSEAAVSLSPGGSPRYGQTVTGWTRSAIAMTDGTGAVFINSSSATLPDVASSSLMILAFYATQTKPTVTRSVLFGGSGVPSSLGEIEIDSSAHFKLIVGGSSSATGTIDHGTGVVPVVLRLDRAHSEQHLVVEHEVVSPAYRGLGHSRGILLGAANLAAPDARFLYMVAWYGPAAEMTDSQTDVLITALGW